MKDAHEDISLYPKVCFSNPGRCGVTPLTPEQVLTYEELTYETFMGHSHSYSYSTTNTAEVERLRALERLPQPKASRPWWKPKWWPGLD